MTIRQGLDEAASKATKQLGDSTGLVADFLYSQINQDGGFRGRSSDSDLYYTMFGIEALSTLGAEIPYDHICHYLRNFYSDSSMDFVHLCCLARCLSYVFSDDIDGALVDSIKIGVDRYFAENRSAYGCFLALGAYQDLGLSISNPRGVVSCLDLLKTPDGGYTNERGISAGSVPATAAAISVLHYLGEKVSDETVQWLLKCCSPEGGFFAMPKAPVADLLSTATAIHALSLAGAGIANLQEQCLDFVDTLWDGKGGFCSSIVDRTCDCEYTFYGLLALGHLSEK
ncbi:MAG: terpene cyclase/mutase family protein [Planctomycetes bacterium]|nr:terpene cyclase/mutase family protein [Planctomycetota bacterium]